MMSVKSEDGIPWCGMELNAEHSSSTRSRKVMQRCQLHWSSCNSCVKIGYNALHPHPVRPRKVCAEDACRMMMILLGVLVSRSRSLLLGCIICMDCKDGTSYWDVKWKQNCSGTAHAAREKVSRKSVSRNLRRNLYHVLPGHRFSSLWIPTPKTAAVSRIRTSPIL